MPTHSDHHIPYDDEDRRTPVTVEDKSQGPLLLAVAVSAFIIVLYFLFLR